MRCFRINLVLTVLLTACAHLKDEVKPVDRPAKIEYAVPDKTLIPVCLPRATWVPGGTWSDVAKLAATYRSELEQCDRLLEPIRQWIGRHGSTL